MYPTASGPSQTFSAKTAVSSTTTNGVLELCVSAAAVGVYPPPPTTITSDHDVAQLMAVQNPAANTSGLVRLLTGRLSDLMHYARHQHTQWLLDVATDICDPLAKRGSLVVWDAVQALWSPVAATDPLRAAVYCYSLPQGTVIALTKISLRVGKSETTVDGNGGTMRNHVMSRDNRCWITRSAGPLVNSHICPKRMGDPLARRILTDFCPDFIQRPGQTVYDVIFGLALIKTLDDPFDVYGMGLRFIRDGEYEVHVFAVPDEPGLVHTINGVYDSHSNQYPLLHGSRAAPPRPSNPGLPPPGLFRWHYAQCVVRRFGHADYKNITNIKYPELPVPMEGDSDEEITDSGSNCRLRQRPCSPT
ncbi:hypothetical protein DFH07DRAFT_749740 [Mycena maculata]|uniref:Uncharacterized protein n=1 Tax=Mycena maculata TaxID=230809 RepID=A0AAD7IIZ5_9AGAR|nr:hypothetical protein DFH07DRAFT_749740 [Mycena maculata]